MSNEYKFRECEELKRRINELERDLLFANDAIAKGDLARQNAGGMETRIQELERERDNYKELIKDSCDDKELSKKALRGILTDFEMDGDSYGVPMLSNLVEQLVKNYKQLERELAEIDAVVARRPALDLPTRRESIERAINTAKRVDELERENTELIEQLSCESMEVDQLQLQVVRLRESLVRYSSQYQRWNTAIADKALTETPSQSAKEVFEPTVELLKHLHTGMPDILKLIKSEIDRLERLCND